MADPPGGYPPEGPENDDGGDVFDNEEEDATEMLDPNHPLLARAQASLKAQLLEQKARLEEVTRERTEDLRVAKNRRESVGVDLYGVQQQLAKLQMTLERTHDNYKVIRQIREQADQDLEALRAMSEEKKNLTQLERRKVEKFQTEVDKLNGTLKQIEAYNEQMKGEIAVTRRATYVAEEAVTRLEKDKKDQDYLIDTLQEQLKQLHQQHQLYEAQLAAQANETRAARDTLAEAESEMEAINFEKKQLVQQWKSSLLGMARRDEALQATEDALRKQREQEMAIDTEVEGFKKSLKAEQQVNEQLTGVLKKVEGDAENASKQINILRERKEKLQDTYIKLKRSLEQTEENLTRSKEETKLREDEQLRTDRETTKCAGEIRQLEAEMLNNVSDQTTVEKSAQKTLQDVNSTRAKVQEHYVQAVQLQNELAKIKVDVLNTQAHNAKLQETMNALDEELTEKGNTIEKYTVEIRRRNDEIESKTKEVDRLNRAYEKLTYNMEDANNGPLEATISNLQREITQKGVEGKELQRRWVGFQVELVSLVNENNVLDEAVQRLKSEHTVMLQKRSRLNNQYEQHMKEMAALDKSVAHMHTDMQRLNTLISKNTELQEMLANDNFVLEMNVVNELKELETEAIKVEQRIDQVVDEKKQVIAEIVEAERQVMLWERKITLERELQEALDPNIGGDIVVAMKKEIHRMELRHSELLRHQEKLIQEMEKAITRRDTINLKGRVMASKKVPDMTESNLKKACVELTKSIRETDVETKRSEERIQGLAMEREQLGQELDDVSLKCRELQDAEQELQMHLATVSNEKMQSLYITSKTQKAAKRLEDLNSGRYQFSHQGDRDSIINDLQRSEAKRQTVHDVLNNLIEREPRLEGPLKKALLLLSI